MGDEEVITTSAVDTLLKVVMEEVIRQRHNKDTVAGTEAVIRQRHNRQRTAVLKEDMEQHRNRQQLRHNSNSNNFDNLNNSTNSQQHHNNLSTMGHRLIESQ